MATTSSVPPTAIDRSSSRRAQPQSTPSRAQSTRTRAPAAAPVTASSGQANPTHHRSSSSRRAGDEIPPHSDYDADYETSNVTDASRRSSSRDPSAAQHAESGRGESGRGASGHQRPSSRYSANMPSHAANSGGPAPVVAPTETKHKASGKSRTTIPAQTGNWVLGKTIGAGSMGKVKLARRAEGG
jgi:hypothetical protein